MRKWDRSDQSASLVQVLSRYSKLESSQAPSAGTANWNSRAAAVPTERNAATQNISQDICLAQRRGNSLRITEI